MCTASQLHVAHAVLRSDSAPSAALRSFAITHAFALQTSLLLGSIFIIGSCTCTLGIVSAPQIWKLDRKHQDIDDDEHGDGGDECNAQAASVSVDDCGLRVSECRYRGLCEVDGASRSVGR
jgi:hypothetical protein